MSSLLPYKKKPRKDFPLSAGDFKALHAADGCEMRVTGKGKDSEFEEIRAPIASHGNPEIVSELYPGEDAAEIQAIKNKVMSFRFDRVREGAASSGLREQIDAEADVRLALGCLCYNKLIECAGTTTFQDWREVISFFQQQCQSPLAEKLYAFLTADQNEALIFCTNEKDAVVTMREFMEYFKRTQPPRTAVDMKEV
eukprot:COSAG01_NODE_5706_length_4085_cov_17.625690_2_plen_197_part_00